MCGLAVLHGCWAVVRSVGCVYYMPGVGADEHGLESLGTKCCYLSMLTKLANFTQVFVIRILSVLPIILVNVFYFSHHILALQVMSF